MSTVFISHAHEDRVQSEPFVAALQTAGHEVWFSLDPRRKSDFLSGIDQALVDCDAVVLFETNKSRESPWVQKELRQSDKLGKPLFIARADPVVVSDEFDLIIDDAAQLERGTSSIGEFGAAFARLLTERLRARGRVIAFWTVKGGAGKTTLTALIGTALARAGRRVLLVDLDPQASLSEATGTPRASAGATSFELFRLPASPEKLSSITCGVPGAPRCLVLGADLGLMMDAQQRSPEEGEVQAFHDNLEIARSEFDYIIFDCRPGLDWITQNALQHCDHILTPMLPNAFSVDAAEIVRKIMRERIQRSYAVPITAIFNQTNSDADRPKLELAKQNFELDFRPLRRTVPRSTAVMHANKLIQTLAKKNQSSEARKFAELFADLSRDVERRTAASVRSKVRAADVREAAEQERASQEKMGMLAGENKQLRDALLKARADIGALEERLVELEPPNEDDYYAQMDEEREEEDRMRRIEELQQELAALRGTGEPGQ